MSEVPQITELSTPPTSTDRKNFRSRADQFLSELPGFGNEANGLANWINGKADQVEADKNQAGIYRNEAEGLRDDTATLTDTALAASNFKGKWSDLTGSLNIPASVYHGDRYWILLADLADVTASEPAEANADWAELSIDLLDWQLGTEQEVTFDTPQEGDITQEWKKNETVIASNVIEFGEDGEGNETITETMARAGRTTEKVTTVMPDGSIKINYHEV